MSDDKWQEMVSIVIPAYNEEKRILETLHELYSFFCDTPHEILVVMDGCSDNTPGIVTEFSNDHPSVKSVFHPIKLGKGGGILLGISKAKGSVIAVVDADGAVPAHDVGKMVDMVTDDFDCAISSRYLPDSVIHTYQPLHRIFFSRGFNLMVRLLFNLPFRDTQCGCKVLKAHVGHTIAAEIQTYNYAFDVELLWRIKKHGYRTVEVPVEWRHMEESKLELKKAIPQMFTAVLKMRLKR
jgi:dolichol-phosphate mannosyltransferase